MLLEFCVAIELVEGNAIGRASDAGLRFSRQLLGMLR
jgi:hypothetical protein